MFIRDGIAYAGSPAPLPSVCGIRPMDGHKLWLRFNSGEAKVFDVSPLLDAPVFFPLKDEDTFRQVYLDYGVPTWNDGQIDLAPDMLYREAIPV